MVTKVKIKYKNLMKLGIKKGKAWEWVNSTKAYWRIAKSPILSRALDNQYWLEQGLKSLSKAISDHALDLNETAVYGTVRTVV